MTEKELEAFRKALQSVRCRYGDSREGAIKLLMEEGLVNAEGKLTEQYAAGVQAVRKLKGQAA
ncbi:hypothetical protein ACI7BZ_17320 [Xanthobacter sp. AM11]|uniref:hypothetical protein n=1 Tax=Xanthobacter sp. AM11 TaxID=3380643 RepID=UPI0039BFF262